MSTQFYGEKFVTQKLYIQPTVVHPQRQQKDILRYIRARKVESFFLLLKKENTWEAYLS